MKMHFRYYFKPVRICIVVLTFAGIFTSCKVLQPHKYPDLSSDNKLFRELDVSDTSTIANIPWKQLFTDVHLQSLIQEALNNNQDLQIAVARVNKAEADLRQSNAAFFPSVTANAVGSATNSELPNQEVTRLYEVYGAASWEIDVWGKLRNTRKANMAAFLASDAYRRTVQTQLIANVAMTYYTLLAYDEQLKITQKTVEKRDSDVTAMTLLKNTDVVTGADLVLSQANRYAAEVTLPDLKQKIYETENALCLLLGKAPAAVERGSLKDQKVLADIKYGIPAQMLANRPDVREAEYRFRYYFHLTNVARAWFYPSLTLTASGGFGESDLSDFFNVNRLLWNISGGLTEPLWNNGINKQRLRVARANEEEYLLTYKKTLLQAGDEVVNALHNYQMASEKIEIRGKQIGYLEKSVDYTMELLKYTNTTNYTDVLTAEVNLLSAQLNEVNDRLQQLNAVISLYQSLGGGWK